MQDALDQLAQADAALNAASPLPFPLPLGELAPVVAGAVRGLGARDWWVPGLRERVGATLRGVPLARLHDGFAGARPYRVAPPDPSPAGRALTAVGLALTAGDDAALVHLGVGSLADGALTEALNLAVLHAARLIVLVAVHPLDGDAPLPRQSAASASALAAAYGIPCVQVDGRDAVAVRDAVAAARATAGPTLIVAALRPT